MILPITCRHPLLDPHSDQPSGSSAQTDWLRAMEYKYGQPSTGQEPDGRAAIKLLTEIAEKHDHLAPYAWYHMADLYTFGIKNPISYVSRNLEKAVQYYNMSAQKGHDASLHMMSFFHASGFGGVVPVDDATAVQLEYIAATRKNYIPSILGMGFRFLYGIGVAKNCEIALKHYKYAAEVSATAVQSGEFSDFFTLNDDDRIHDDTRKIWKRFQQYQSQHKEIFEYWKQRATSGDAMAQYELAKLLDSNKNSEKDGQTVKQLLENSAKQNFAPANRDLGAIYAKGVPGVEQDSEKSLKYYQRAADLQDPEALNFLGYLHYFGDPSLTGGNRNQTLAIDYLIRAAMQDHAESLFLLGEIMNSVEDHSFAKNQDGSQFKKAFHFYRRAADLGYIHAFWRLGQAYEGGQGVSTSCSKAVQAYKVVAESGSWAQEIRKGLAYYIINDFEVAALLFDLSAREGYEIAQSNCAKLYSKLEGCPPQDCNYQAREMYFRALQQGNYAAFYDLASLRDFGHSNADTQHLYHELLHLSLIYGDTRSLISLSDEYSRQDSWTWNSTRRLELAELLLLYALDQVSSLYPTKMDMPTSWTQSMRLGLQFLLQNATLHAKLKRIQILRRFQTFSEIYR